jgi:DNA-binding PadR family transcriptional regulator
MDVGVHDLSELEGAILSEIEHRGQQTAFQVRRAFAESVSLEWKVSTGAVYPAVRRLEQAKLLAASAPKGGRKARILSLTGIGREALTRWASDAVRGASVGVDPFRLRSGIWLTLPSAQRKTLLSELEAQIVRQIEEFEHLRDSVDAVEAPRMELALALQKFRLTYVREWQSAT